jgi:hypothetical protein
VDCRPSPHNPQIPEDIHWNDRTDEDPLDDLVWRLLGVCDAGCHSHNGQDEGTTGKPPYGKKDAPAAHVDPNVVIRKNFDMLANDKGSPNK